jgi:hypothetical protein
MSRQLRIGSKSKNMSGSEKKKFGQASVQQLYEIAFCLWILTYELNSSLGPSGLCHDSLAVAGLGILFRRTS